MLKVRRVAAVAVALSAVGAPAAVANHRRAHHAEKGAYGSEARRAYGATSLALDPAAANALASLGVTPGLVGPAFAAPDGSLAFPITDSPAQVKRTGVITHAGGISLTKGSTVVTLTDFDIVLGSAPTLTAVVNGGPRVTILNLDLSGATVTRHGGEVITGPAVASLTATAAKALNDAFGTTAFTEGLVLGRATIDQRGHRGDESGSSRGERGEESPGQSHEQRGSRGGGENTGD